MEATIELLQAENATLQAGYDAARLEIESLQARGNELGRQLEKEINARKQAQIENEQLKERIARGDIKHEKMRLEAKVAELQAMLQAVGAGGVEPLRCSRCLSQIAEPEQCAWCA